MGYNAISPRFGTRASLLLFCHLKNLIMSDKNKNIIKTPRRFYIILCLYCNHKSSTPIYNYQNGPLSMGYGTKMVNLKKIVVPFGVTFFSKLNHKLIQGFSSIRDRKSNILNICINTTGIIFGTVITHLLFEL